MTSLTEAGFGTHHWILMRFEPHFSRQVIAFQRKLKTQLECMENGCDDDTETVLEVPETKSDELKYQYTHCATTSANAPSTNDSALDEKIVEPLDITINAEEENCVSSCASPKPTHTIPKENHSDPSGKFEM